MAGTLAELLAGADMEGWEAFCERIYNFLKNHARQVGVKAALTDVVAGMIASEAGDDKLHHRHAAAWDEILQAITSYDTPVQLGMNIMEAKTDNYVITTADFGKILTMESAAAKTFSLPSVAAANIGAVLTFYKIGAGKVTIDGADADTIQDSSAGGTIYNEQAAETWAFIKLRLVTATKWMIESFIGTWTTT